MNEKKRRALELMRKYYGGIVEDESVSISGKILNFTTDIIRPLKSLILNIEPRQSGSGDPSPTNIRPISGYDAVNVTRMGRNVCDMPDFTATAQGLTFNCVDGFITVNGTARATTLRGNNNVFLKAGTYTLADLGGNSTNNYYVSVHEKRSATEWVMLCNTANNSTPSFTIDTDEEVVVRVRVVSGSTLNNVVFKPMIVVGTTEPTEWEPYTAQTYPFSFASAGTVYGGTLDVTNGILTVDRMVVDLSTLTWRTRYTGSNNKTISSTLPAPYNIPSSGNFQMLAEYYIYVEGVYYVTTLSAPDDLQVGIRSYNPSSAISSSTIFIVLPADSEPIGKLVYKIATPLTYQLTPSEVTTLLGDNNIWMDAEGTIDAEYWRIRQ